jgi:hypothetical protein
MVRMRHRVLKRLVVLLGGALGVTAPLACTDLKSGDPLVADAGNGTTDAGPLADVMLLDASADVPTPGDGDASDASTLPGTPETVAENIRGGLGVALTSSHVYYLEQGQPVGGSNFEAYFRRLPAASVCPPGQNCGAALSDGVSFPYFYGDFHGGPVASDVAACIDVTVNAARNTEVSCLRQSDGKVVSPSMRFFAATVQQVVGTQVYVSSPASTTGGNSNVYVWDASTPTVAPRVILTRTTPNVSAFAIEGDTLFWLERTSTMTSLWTRVGLGGTPTQLAAARPGSGRISLDGSGVYVSRLDEGLVLRYGRVAPTSATEILKGLKTPGPVLIRRNYLLVLAYGDAPDYANSELLRCTLNGQSCVPLSRDPVLSGVAANDTTAFYLTFGQTPDFKGRLRRIRF